MGGSGKPQDGSAILGGVGVKGMPFRFFFTLKNKKYITLDNLYKKQCH